VKLLFDNPEFVRNARIQLRPGRMLAAAVICAVISITVWASMVDAPEGPSTMDHLTGPGAVFALILYFQITVLLIGGGIYCLQSVHREKDLNSFDYQRVTRLTSLELAIGKLLGAPILAYFVVLCLMPVALIGAIRGHVPPLIVLEAYVLLLLGSITFHALALLISVLLGRGTAALAILFFLAIVGFSSINFYRPSFFDVPTLTLHRLSPYALEDLVAKPAPAVERAESASGSAAQLTDLFLGEAVSHTFVLLGLYLTFTGWFLLGITRNIKRDPSVYETYSPSQALAFLLYLNFLLASFFPWEAMFQEHTVSIGSDTYHRPASTPSGAEQAFFSASVWLFAILALILVRNRERVRRRLGELGSRALGWWASLWPAPYLVGGIAIAGVGVIGLISHYRDLRHEDLRLMVYHVAFVAVWMTRDALYFQWMNLRRVKRPLASAGLYWLIFYVCVSIVFSTLHFDRSPRSAALTAIVLPWSGLAVNERMWGGAAQIFLGALVLQGTAAVLFAWLHRRRLREFKPRAGAEEATAGTLPQHA
jgi:hypothetical protein